MERGLAGPVVKLRLLLPAAPHEPDKCCVKAPCSAAVNCGTRGDSAARGIIMLLTSCNSGMAARAAGCGDHTPYPPSAVLRAEVADISTRRLEMSLGHAQCACRRAD